MCTYSYVGDHWQYPVVPQPIQWPPYPAPTTTFKWNVGEVTRKEFDELKKNFEDLLTVLKLARVTDALMGHPDCEVADKIARIREFAKFVGLEGELEDALKLPPIDGECHAAVSRDSRCVRPAMHSGKCKDDDGHNPEFYKPTADGSPPPPARKKTAKKS